MDEKTKVRIIVLIILVAILIGIHVVSGQQRPIGECTEYECDVKTRVYTTINITKEGEYFAMVQGERVYKTFNDPLTMYDQIGNKTAYADDTYHLIADSTSKYLSRDYKVRITDRCQLDEKTVHMIFVSYYSDQKADS